MSVSPVKRFTHRQTTSRCSSGRSVANAASAAAVLRSFSAISRARRSSALMRPKLAVDRCSSRGGFRKTEGPHPRLFQNPVMAPPPISELVPSKGILKQSLTPPVYPHGMPLEAYPMEPPRLHYNWDLSTMMDIRRGVHLIYYVYHEVGHTCEFGDPIKVTSLGPVFWDGERFIVYFLDANGVRQCLPVSRFDPSYVDDTDPGVRGGPL